MSGLLSQQHLITLSVAGSKLVMLNHPLVNKPINYLWASVEQKNLIYCYH